MKFVEVEKKICISKLFFLIIYVHEEDILIYIFFEEKHYLVRKHLHLQILNIFHSQSTTPGKIKDKEFRNPVFR